MNKRSLVCSCAAFVVATAFSVLIITQTAKADPPYDCEFDPYHRGYQVMHFCGIGCNLPLTCACCVACYSECDEMCWEMAVECKDWDMYDLSACLAGCWDAYVARGCVSVCGDPGK